MPEIFGKNVKPQTLWIAGGVTVVFSIAYVRYTKTQKAAAASAAAQTATGTGNGPSDQTDPATGFPYGSAEDAAALSAQGNYISPAGGFPYGGPNNYPTQNPGGFTSNAQWSQSAESFLVSEGADANAVGNALGKYITGQTVNDPTVEGYINQAIAFEGYPPVAGPDGFPPSIRTAPAPPGPGDGHSPNQNVVVPKVAGLSADEAFRILRSEALNPQPGGIKKTRIVTGTNPEAGKSVPKHTTVHVTVK